MNNLKPFQLIVIGVVALFGIPVCIGFAVGYFAGFWVGLVATVFAIALIAFIAQRWWQRRNRDKDD